MKRISKLTVIALAAFLLLGSLPVLAKDRPFALNGNGVATFVTNEAGLPVSANVTSSSTATHLGLCTTVGVVNFTPDPQTPGRLLSSGTGTITAANGDQIQIEFTGVLDPPEPGSPTAIDRPVFRFIGGTGRFAGATGQADAVVVINLLTGAFEITMVGRIDY